MAADNLYLDNIDEFVNDENRIVTYKWLSLTLQIHCNTAKQMLFKFLEDQRNIKDDSSITVSYFVSGLAKSSKDDCPMFKCAVVPEERLDVYKASLEFVTSCHIYSIQKLKLKDSNPLYMGDYEKITEDILTCNKFSAIQNDQVQIRAADEMESLKPQFRSNTDATEKAVKSTGSSGQSSTAPASKKKPTQTSAIAGMFAKQEKKATSPVKQEKKATSPVKQDKKTEVKAEKKQDTKAGGKKATAMMAFLSKDSGNKTEAKKEETKKSEPVKKEEQKLSAAKTKSPQGTNKKTARPVDSDDDAVTTKRQRIKEDLFASSEEEEEEEEEMDVEPESPIPEAREPSPVPEPSPKPKQKDIVVVEEEEDIIPKQTSKAKEPPAKVHNSGERRRKRVKRAVQKTYMGDDGFMVTEKAYESASTDASEAEESVVSRGDTRKPTATKPAAKDQKKRSPVKSPPKKGATAQTGKQTSLMSFFKKK